MIECRVENEGFSRENLDIVVESEREREREREGRGTWVLCFEISGTGFKGGSTTLRVFFEIFVELWKI